MATKFARAGGGNWTTNATWSTTSSAGAANTTAPTAADDAVLDAGSGAVTIDSGAVCRSMDCNGYTNTLTFTAGVTLGIGDGTAGAGNIAVRLSAGMTFTVGSDTSTFSFNSTSATVQTVTSAGKTMPTSAFGGNGGSWQFADNMTFSGFRTVTHTRGTLDVNGKTVSCAVFSSNGALTRTLTLGAASITCTFANSGGTFQINNNTGLTVTANTATITTSGANAGPTIANTNMNGSTITVTGSGTMLISLSGSTVANLNVTGNAAITYIAAIQTGNFTVTTAVTLTGNSALNQGFFGSGTLGTVRTITMTGATLNITNFDLRDLTVTGSPTVGTATRVGDCGNNTGLGSWITPGVPRFAVTAGNTGTAATWAATSGGATSGTAPLPQDTVTFDNNSGAGTYTMNMARFPGINFNGGTGFTRTFASANAWECYGSITLASGMTLTAANTVTFIGTGTNTLTTNTKTVTFGCLFSRGTCGFGDNVTNSRDIAGAIQVNLIANFNDNGRTVTVTGAGASVVAGSSLGATMTLTGTWKLQATTAATIWNMGAGVTYSVSTCTLIVDAASALPRVMAMANQTWGTLQYVVTGSTGALEITNNTGSAFTTIECSDTALLKYPYLGYMDGATAGRYWDSGAVSNVNTAATSITLIACVAALDWTPATSLYICGWGTPSGASSTLTAYMYLSATGSIGFQIVNSGNTASFATSSVATGFTDGLGTRRWIAAKLDVVAKTVNFYTSTNAPDSHPGHDVTGGSWSALGSTGRTFSGAWDGTYQSKAVAGISFSSATQSWAGKIFYAEGLKDSTSTPTWEVKPPNEILAATSFTDEQGITWTGTGTNMRVARDRMLVLPSGVTTTVTNFLVSGVDANNLYPVVSSSGTSATATLSKSSGTVVRSYLYLRGIAATGGAAWYAGRTSTDAGANTGWLFVDFIAATMAAPLGGLTGAITAIVSRIGTGSIDGTGTIVASGFVVSSVPTVLTTVGILGCTEFYGVFIANRAGFALSNELPFTALNWERVVSDTSTAEVTIDGLSGPSLSECCALLEGVDAWKNELHIYRNGERIWAGPITGMDFEEESAVIRASDPSAWWDRRRIHENQHHEDADLGEIFANYVADAMSVDNVPGMTVPVVHVGRKATRRVKAADRKIARPEIDELARTGLVWTVVNREIVLAPVANTTVTHLNDSHFRGPSSLTVDGRMATNVTVLGAARAQGRPQVSGTARSNEDDIIADYGVHEWVVTEDTVRDNDSAREAADRRLTRFELPAALFTGADLDPDFPLAQNELIPGRRFYCDLHEQCRPVSGRYRLTRVAGTVDDETDTITMDVQPIGRGVNAL